MPTVWARPASGCGGNVNGGAASSGHWTNSICLHTLLLWFHPSPGHPGLVQGTRDGSWLTKIWAAKPEGSGVLFHAMSLLGQRAGVSLQFCTSSGPFWGVVPASCHPQLPTRLSLSCPAGPDVPTRLSLSCEAEIRALPGGLSTHPGCLLTLGSCFLLIIPGIITVMPV